MPPAQHVILTGRSLDCCIHRSPLCIFRLPSLGLHIPGHALNPSISIRLRDYLSHIVDGLRVLPEEEVSVLVGDAQSVIQKLRLMSCGELPFKIELIDPSGKTSFDETCIEAKPPPDVMDQVQAIATDIASGCFKNIIILLGAGISVSAGIPDFRSPKTGLYHRLSELDLPRPESVFELAYFRRRPEAFFTLASELWPGKGRFQPTLAHWAIRLLTDKGFVRRIYTQNIDGLELLTGINPDALVEVHGTFSTASCIDCRRPHPVSLITESFSVVKCSDCGSLVKPDIVFFGEQLPERFHDLVPVDFSKCDLLLVLGTSLSVQPCASLIDLVPSSCRRVLINRDLVGLQESFFGSGFRFTEHGSRDVFWQGDCDERLKMLMSLCGWEDELLRFLQDQVPPASV
jgi:NAD+-dependent protein deacetylase sirtuin 2